MTSKRIVFETINSLVVPMPSYYKIKNRFTYAGI